MKHHDFATDFDMPVQVAELGVSPDEYGRLALRFRLILFWAALVGVEAAVTLDYKSFDRIVDLCEPTKVGRHDDLHVRNFAGLSVGLVPRNIFELTVDHLAERALHDDPRVSGNDYGRLFVEPDGQPTSLLDIKMAIWRLRL